MNKQKYTLTLKLYNSETNDSRIIEIEGLSGKLRDLKFEVIGFQNWTKEDEENELEDSEYSKQEFYNECLLEEQEISKDLMLDEVISSQHLEIERLTEIIQDLVVTNLKLVEMLGKTK